MRELRDRAEEQPTVEDEQSSEGWIATGSVGREEREGDSGEESVKLTLKRRTVFRANVELPVEEGEREGGRGECAVLVSERER